MNSLISIMDDDNAVTISDLRDEEQNMKDLLDLDSVLNYINCTNVTIIIDSRIDRVTLSNCDNIRIEAKELIHGMDITDSSDINVIIKKNNKHSKYIIDTSNNVTMFIPRKSKHNDCVVKNSKDIDIIGPKS